MEQPDNIEMEQVEQEEYSLNETIQQMLQDEATYEGLLMAIDRKDQEIVLLRRQFNDTVAQEPIEIQDDCREAIQQVYRSFDRYNQIFEELEYYGKELDTDMLEMELKKLSDADRYLDAAFQRFRGDALIARGPSSHAGINLLINTVGWVLEGNDMSDELQQYVQGELTSSDTAFETLALNPSTFFIEGLKLFYSNYQGVLRDFATFFSTGDPAALKALEKQLQAVGEQFSRVDLNHLIRMLSTGPTPVPAVNLVINSGHRYIDGNGELGVLRYFLEELWQVVNTTRFRYEEIARTVGETVKIEDAAADEADVIGEALDIISEALEELDTFLENNDADLFGECAEKLKSSAEMFAGAVNNLKYMNEGREITCFRCGSLNPRGTVYCHHCNVELLEAKREVSTTLNTVADENGIGAQGSSETQMTEHIRTLFDAADAVAEGSLSPGEFRVILDQSEKRLKEAYKAARDVPEITSDFIRETGAARAEEIQAILMVAADDYRTGLDDLAKGFQMFREFSKTLQAATHREAKEITWYATGILQKVQKHVELTKA